ncbi:MAG: RNA polymerase sigma factor [Actinomycetota bacterium]
MLIRTSNATTSEATDDPNFAARIEAAIGGDEAAVQELVDEFQPGLGNYARGRGLADPDGVVNAALSDGLRNLGDFRGRNRRSFRAYLYRILRRRIVDEYRRDSVRPRTAVDPVEVVLDELVDETSSAFDQRIVDRQHIDEILDLLTAEQREILEMRVLAGLSIKETANRTGRSESAVKAMQRRALSSLRSALLAAAVLAILGLLGYRLLVSAAGPVTVVENAPAIEPGPGLGGLVDQPPVIEVEGPDGDQRLGGGVTGRATETEAAEPAGNGTEPVAEPAGPAAPSGTATDEASTTDASDSATDATTPGGAEDGSGAQAAADPEAADAVPVPEPYPESPCTVRTAAKPVVGEVAFATFDFSGPYDLLDRTSVDLIGGDVEKARPVSGLLDGIGDPSSVRHGTTIPFVLQATMFDADGALDVRASLADGGLAVSCLHSNRRLWQPCTATPVDEFEAGGFAEVTFRANGIWRPLAGTDVYVLGARNRSAMVGPAKVPFDHQSTASFTIAKQMLTDDGQVVDLAFADGTARFRCRNG